jgi:hypothetical protein
MNPDEVDEEDEEDKEADEVDEESGRGTGTRLARQK